MLRLLAVLLISATLAGAEKVPPPKTPISAVEVLNRYIAATGGMEARRYLKTMEIYGAVKIPPWVEATGDDFRFYFGAPSRDLFQLEMRSHGQFTVGHDQGKRFVKRDATGIMMMNGVSASLIERDLLLLIESDWGKDAYRKIDLAGLAKIEGKWAYAMRFEPKQGDPQVRYFDSETFLLVRIDQAQRVMSTKNGPEYAYKIETYLSDYQTREGVSLPREIRYRCSVGDLLLKVSGVKVNVPIDEAFARAQSDK